MPIYKIGEALTPDTGINECNVLTIFPMGLQCITTEPSSITSVDGQIFLNITGGTPPYNVIWDNNNTSPLLINLPFGSYTATVVDSFGDYTASTTCVLSLPSPTPTSTPLITPTPSSVYYEYCLTIIQGNIYTRRHFNPYGVENGKPSWLSDDNNYKVFWNNTISKWEYKAVTYSGAPFIVNSTLSIPPINNWQFLGQPSGQISGNLGICSTGTPLSMNVQVNNPIYGSDGSIIITPIGGTTPYQYSLNNGLTYQNSPIFTNLNGGSFNLVLKDASGATFNSIATLIAPPPPTVYTVLLNTSTQIITNTSSQLVQIYTTNISVNPQLPSGATITMNLQHLNSFSASPTTVISSATSISTLYKNSSPYLPTSGLTGFTTSNPLPNCIASTVHVKNQIDNWNAITLSRSDTMYIYTITTVNKYGNDNCYIGAATDTFSKNTLSISGCTNCVVQ